MTLSIDDVLDVEYPDAPSWSADGRFVAASTYEDDGKSLRIGDVRGERPNGTDDGTSVRSDGATDLDVWRFEPTDGGVATLAWAPEPTPSRLALVTDEDRLVLINAARRTSETLADGVAADDLAWTDGGRRLAAYRDGQPCVIDLDGATRTLDVPERGPFLAEDRMLAWGPGDRLAYRFVDRETKQIGVVDVETGDLCWRSREAAYSTRNPAWLGDGRLLVDRLGEEGTVREFVAVDVENGAETTLFREEDREEGIVSRGRPVVAPDGERFAAVLPIDGWEHLYVFDAGSGERTQLTAGAFEDKGLAGSRPRWLDGETLVFASNRRDPGRRDLFAVSPARTGAEPSVTPLVTGGGTDVYPRPSPDGEALAYVHADRSVSPECRVRTLDDGDGEPRCDGEPRLVTRSAVRDWPVEPVDPERVTYESVDGREIHAYLLDPRETDAVDDDATDLPAVVWVHGGPMRQMRDGWHPSRSYGIAYAAQQYLAHEGYVGLMVNYRGGIGYGREFRQALAGRRGRDEMDDVARGAELLADRDEVDPDAIGIWGLSYGGYATLQLLGTHPGTFAVGVNLAGLADLELYRDWAVETKYPAAASSMAVRLGGEPWEAREAWAEASPATHMDQYEAPLYSFHGTGDRYVNPEQLDVVVDRTLELGLDAEWEYYPDESHVFDERATWERALGTIETAFDEHLR